MVKVRRTLASAWVIVSLLEGAVYSAPMVSGVPSVVKAEPVPEWNAKFAGMEGWIGGDGAYSVALGPKRVLWLFGDTLIGTAKDGQRSGAKMVNNTIGIQTGLGKDAAIEFITGKMRDGKAASFFTPENEKGWFWPQAPVRVGDKLFVFLPHLEKTDEPGAFGFKPVGQQLAVIQNPDDNPSKWQVKYQKLPFVEFGPNRERSWGSAVLTDGEFLNIFGYDEERGKGLGKRRLTLARVTPEKLTDFSAWRFRTANGWSDKPTDAAPLADGLATEFSVSRVPGGKGYVLVHTENGLSDRIVGRFADVPEGPWSASVLLYTCPEMAKDKGVFSYAAKAHPWSATENELVISYCVNSWKFDRLFKDDAIYRPKFVRVVLLVGKSP